LGAAGPHVGAALIHLIGPPQLAASFIWSSTPLPINFVSVIFVCIRATMKLSGTLCHAFARRRDWSGLSPIDQLEAAFEKLEPQLAILPQAKRHQSLEDALTGRQWSGRKAAHGCANHRPIWQKRP
jgi:hypothetical protein